MKEAWTSSPGASCSSSADRVVSADAWDGWPFARLYMLLVAGVTPERRRAVTEEERKLWGIDQLNVVRSDIPAVTHVDGTARIQTVDRHDEPLMARCLERFEERTGVPATPAQVRAALGFPDISEHEEGS